MNSLTHAALPAGSTIILSTTSPDKRREYEVIFQRYDINFIFLEDLGLSPQKTDEMTNTYAGNLLQKAGEVSLALYANLTDIQHRLRGRGFDTEKPLLGMVEDSGIEVYPAMQAPGIQDAFRSEFKRRIDDRIHNEFLINRDLRDSVFPGMNADELLDALANMEMNNEWMTNLENETGFPGPNYKPIYEALPGGVREFYDLLDETMRDILRSSGHAEAAADEDQSLLRFTNRCQLMLVPPSANPMAMLDAASIIEGVSHGDVVPSSVAQSLIDYRQNLHKVKHQLGRLFTADYIQPDGREVTRDTQRRLIEERGLLTSEPGEVADYYRLHAVSQIEERYQLPRAERYTETHQRTTSDGRTKERICVYYRYQQRIEHAEMPEVLILHSGTAPPPLVGELKQVLQSHGYIIHATPTMAELLGNPNLRLMGNADIVLMIPGEDASPLDHAELILAAAVDKQVMPSAKEKLLVTLNAKTDDHGDFDQALKILRHKKYSGLKNGISEINHVIEYDRTACSGAEGAAQLYDEMKPLLDQERERKKYRLTHIAPIQPPLDIPSRELPHLPEESPFSVFVAGGAANEYTGFKAPSNQLGRYIHDKGWVLVTGAGQKEGPMGAVHSGFVEAYLHYRLSLNYLSADERGVIYDTIKRWATQNTTRRNLRAEDGLTHQRRILSMLMGLLDKESGRLIEHSNINAEYLAHEAPEILVRLLDPEPGSLVDQLIGSLAASGRMIGYSMPPLLISEGTGHWPVGMQGHNAGNMQRRMDRMLEADAHVFLAGGQGTDQELLRSAAQAIAEHPERQQSGLAPRPLLLLEQPVYKGGVYEPAEGTLFKPSLEIIEAQLRPHSLSFTDIGLSSYPNIRDLEHALTEASLQVS